jgi:hypothetical protein
MTDSQRGLGRSLLNAVFTRSELRTAMALSREIPPNEDRSQRDRLCLRIVAPAATRTLQPGIRAQRLPRHA